MAPGDSFSPPPAVRGHDVRTAIDASHLRSLSPELITRLMAGSTRVHVPAGSRIHREGDTTAQVDVVVSGLIRVYVTAPDGRTMTIRYCRVGDLIGAVSLFATPFSHPATIQAVTDSDLLTLRASVVRKAADRDVRVARALLEELSERVLSFIAEIPGNAFATVRQRVARHLLDLATGTQRSSDLVAAISQQELADAVDTIREVVVRTLRELRQEGLLQTRRDGIVLLEPERLSDSAYPSRAGTSAPGEWNESH